MELNEETKMLTFWGYLFYGLALADFLGMFFGYDFTGQEWTPLLFGGIGQVLIIVDEQKKNVSRKQEEAAQIESEGDDT